jgi:hypothetical protein
MAAPPASSSPPSTSCARPVVIAGELDMNAHLKSVSVGDAL